MKFGRVLGVEDVPNHRSSHTQVTPRGGGIGILAALLVCSILLQIPFFFWAPALGISLISLWGGDKYRVPITIRLLLQLICGIAFILLFAMRYSDFKNILLFSFPMMIFVVGTSNFYNFMDGIDGIAGISGIIGFLFLAYSAHDLPVDVFLAPLCIAIALACMGFLIFNFPKAKVFMGDIGSVLIGFLFSTIVLILSDDLIDFLVMIGFLFPFYFDELFTMAVRIKKKQLLSDAHREHIYQILANKYHMAHWKISMGYGGIQILIGFSAISMKSEGMFVLIMLYIFICLLLISLVFVIRRKAALQ